MTISSAEEAIKTCYRKAWQQYRHDDEIEVTTENHRRLESMLRSLTSSFEREISVLDAGCGTGRYFHCLDNVSELVGIDLSPEMLDAAQRPVRSELITAKTISLQCGNIHQVSFPPQSFDFIYSLGMFGNGCPVTFGICNRLYEWLKPDGKLFFDTIQQINSRSYLRGRKMLRECVHKILPTPVLHILNGRQQNPPLYSLTKEELEILVGSTPFMAYQVSEQILSSPLATGPRLECIAEKKLASAARPSRSSCRESYGSATHGTRR